MFFLLYQVFRCSSSTLSSKGTECDRGRGQTLNRHTNQCSFYLRLDSAEMAWGEGYENIAWSKGTRPSLGVGSEKVSHERSVWTDIWKLRGKKAGGSQANRQDRPGHFTSLKRRWLVYLALRPRWPLDLDFSLGNLVCKYPTAYHS